MKPFNDGVIGNDSLREERKVRKRFLLLDASTHPPPVTNF